MSLKLQFLITTVRLICSVDVETFLIAFIFSNLPLLNNAQFGLSSLVAYRNLMAFHGSPCPYFKYFF